MGASTFTFNLLTYNSEQQLNVPNSNCTENSFFEPHISLLKRIRQTVFHAMLTPPLPKKEKNMVFCLRGLQHKITFYVNETKENAWVLKTYVLETSFGNFVFYSCTSNKSRPPAFRNFQHFFQKTTTSVNEKHFLSNFFLINVFPKKIKLLVQKTLFFQKPLKKRCFFLNWFAWKTKTYDFQ